MRTNEPAPDAAGGEDLRTAVLAAIKANIKVDATGLAPAVASAYIVGFEEATDAILPLIASLQERVSQTARIGASCTEEADQDDKFARAYTDARRRGDLDGYSRILSERLRQIDKRAKAANARADAAEARALAAEQALEPFAAAFTTRPAIIDTHPDYDQENIDGDEPARIIRYGDLRRAAEVVSIAHQIRTRGAGQKAEGGL